MGLNKPLSIEAGTETRAPNEILRDTVIEEEDLRKNERFEFLKKGGERITAFFVRLAGIRIHFRRSENAEDESVALEEIDRDEYGQPYVRNLSRPQDVAKPRRKS